MNIPSLFAGVISLVFGILLGFSSSTIGFALSQFGQCLVFGLLILGVVFLVIGLGTPRYEKRK